jgi:hypothetical protein
MRSKGKKPKDLSGKIRLDKKTHGNAPDILREVNLISLAANLDDPRFHAVFERSGKLLVIVEKLTSINATRIQQRRSSLDSRHYVE